MRKEVMTKMNLAIVPPMDLAFWVPIMFALGLVSMGLVMA
jgi:hypothetical protein